MLRGRQLSFRHGSGQGSAAGSNTAQAAPPPTLPTHRHPHTDRVDRLRPEEQLTLKVASVLGLTLYRQLLQVNAGGLGVAVCGAGWPRGVGARGQCLALQVPVLLQY